MSPCTKHARKTQTTGPFHGTPALQGLARSPRTLGPPRLHTGLFCASVTPSPGQGVSPRLSTGPVCGNLIWGRPWWAARGPGGGGGGETDAGRDLASSHQSDSPSHSSGHPMSEGPGEGGSQAAAQEGVQNSSRGQRGPFRAKTVRSGRRNGWRGARGSAKRMGSAEGAERAAGAPRTPQGPLRGCRARQGTCSHPGTASPA